MVKPVNKNCKRLHKDKNKDLSSKERKAQMDDLYDELAELEATSNKADFNKKAKEILQGYEETLKVENAIEVEQLVQNIYNEDQVDLRMDTYTNSKGVVNFQRMILSFLTNEGRVGNKLNTHNIEVVKQITQSRLLRIMEHGLAAKKTKDLLIKHHSLMSAMQSRQFDKEIFDYIESGGEKQVSDTAKVLAEVVMDFNREEFKIKQEAGYLTHKSELDKYVMNQSRFYNADKIRANFERFITLMKDSIYRVGTFGEDATDEQVDMMIRKMANKIIAKDEANSTGAIIEETFKTNYESIFKKRYSAQRKMQFKDGHAYNVYKEFGEDSILDAMFSTAHALSRDVGFSTILGPKAMENRGGGLSGLKTSIMNKIDEQIKLHPEHADEYIKQKKAISDGNYSKLHNERAIIKNLTGEVHRISSPWVAMFGATARSFTSSVLLGKAVIASLVDIPSSFEKISQASGKGYLSTMGESTAMMFNMIKDPELRRTIMRYISFALDSAIVNEQRIYAESNPFMKKLGSAMTWYWHINPLGLLTRVSRGSQAMLQAINFRDVFTSKKGLDKVQSIVFQKYGITDQIGKLLSDYSIDSYKGMKYINSTKVDMIPDHLLQNVQGIDHFKFNTADKVRDEIMRRYDSYSYNTVNQGIATPNVQIDSIGTAAGDRGDITREFWDSALMFKKITFQVWKILAENTRVHTEAGGVNAAMKLSRYGAGLIGFAYLAECIDALTDGRSPPDPSSPATMKKVLARSGIGGIPGDILLGSARDKSDAAKDAIVGPAMGRALDILSLGEGIDKMNEALEGNTKKQHEVLNYFKQNIPGNNLFPVDYFLRKVIIDSISGTDIKAEGKKYEKMQKFSGDLWNQEEIF